MSNNTVEELEQQQQQLQEIEQLLEGSPDDQSLLDLKADLLELISVTLANIESIAGAAPCPQDQQAQSTTSLPADNDDERDAPQLPSTDQTDPSESTSDIVASQISNWSTVTPNNASTNKRPVEEPPSSVAGGEEIRKPPLHEGDEAAYSGSNDLMPSTTATTDSLETTNQRPTKKVKKSTKTAATVQDTFVIPTHLQPNEQDSTAEANRKKRAVKALKNQWRSQRKEQEANQKQKSWQNFQSKKKKIKSTAAGSSSIFSTSTDTNAKVGVVGGRNLTDFASRKRHK